MLYDNALLARAYLHGWQVSGDALLRRTAEETLDWALREMRAPEGGFYSALDADSEGVEGKFYVWTLDELRAALGDDADAAIAWFGATERGNFEGANVLESRGPEPPPEQRERIRAPLLAARAAARAPGPRRQAPGGLERADDRARWPRPAPCSAARTYLDAARGAAAFVLEQMRDARRPAAAHASTPASAKLNAYLEDHAFLLEALLVLYEATFEERWFAEARALADTIVDALRRPRARRLLLDRRRPRAARRAAQGPRGRADPVGRLGRGASACCASRRSPARHAYEDQAAGQLRAPARDRAAPPDRVRAPAAGARLLPGARGARSRWPATRRASRRWPRVVRECAPARTSCSRAGRATAPTAVPLMEGRTPVDGRAAAYVCERFACRSRSPSPTSCDALLEA